MVSRKITAAIPYVWGVFLWLILLFFQATGIYGGDSGDLVTAAALGGVPHPPGYPLYSFLGFLLGKLPLATPAWRIGLLSSLPHALTATVVTLLVWQVSGWLVAGIFASLVLFGNYLFFLYGTTAEVFAILDLFVILLVYLSFRWIKTKKDRYLYSLSFVAGLSLTHHLLILFLFPVLGYWMWPGLKGQWRRTLRCLGLFVLGLLPYLYIPIAARRNVIINWDRAVDLGSFIRLVTRADYGTFLSGGFYGSEIVDRLLQLKLYGTFVRVDLTWIGIVLFGLGIWWGLRAYPVWMKGVAAALILLGPVFFFYASFPLVNRFTVGTYERFLLPGYTLFAVFIGLGLHGASRLLRRFGRGLFASSWVQKTFIAVLFLYPLITVAMTFWRFWGLRQDRTAEELGYDILASVPKDAVLLLERDTPLFTTQYVRYALGRRQDVKLVHASLLPSSWYPALVGSVFSDLRIPDVRGAGFAAEFLRANSQAFPIASNTRLPAPDGWVWVPNGLVFLLEPKQKVGTLDAVESANQALWSKYRDPTRGILKRYNHLMLADVRDVYMNARLEFGKILIRADKISEAKTEFERAIALGGDTQASDSYVYLGLAELFLKNCQNALFAFGRARETAAVPAPEITLYEASTYRDCLGNAARGGELLDDFERARAERETPIGGK